MYEVGEYVGHGEYSSVFKLKGHSRLLVKVRRSKGSFFHPDKRILMRELVKAKILRRLGVPIGRYVGLIKVNFSDYFVQINQNNLRLKLEGAPYYKVDSRNVANDIVAAFDGKVRWGLVVEFIEHDVQEAWESKIVDLVKFAHAKIKGLGIIAKDSFVRPSSDEDGQIFHFYMKNILWSKKKKKIYFIDFDDWYIPKKYYTSIFHKWI